MKRISLETMALLTTLFIYLSVGLFLFWLLTYFQQRRLKYYASKLDGPLSLPFLGSGFYILGGSERLVQNVIYLTNKYKSPWKIWLGSKLFVILSDPEDMKIVSNQTLDKGDNYKFLEPLLGYGLITAPVEQWKPHRRVVRNVFKLPILNDFVEVFAKHSQTLVESLETHVGDDYFDVYPLMNENSLNITFETAVGGKYTKQVLDSSYPEVLGKAFDMIFPRFFTLWQRSDFLWKITGNARKVAAFSQPLHTAMRQIVAEKKRADYRTERDGFLDLLIKFSKRERDWSEAELVEEAMTMTAAASDSLGSAACYTLLMLGMHPRVQDRVYEELFDIFGRSDRSVAHEDLPRMKFLEQVIKETLRLFPLSVGVIRHLEKDITISNGHVLPEGCECLIAFMYTHRDSNIWPNPFHFDPERFTSEEIAKRHPFAFMPFGGGPRGCLGFKYALMAVQTIIATVLRSYKVATDYKSVLDVEFEPGVILKPRRGHKVALQKRI